MTGFAQNPPSAHGAVVHPRIGRNKTRVHSSDHVHWRVTQQGFHLHRMGRKATIEAYRQRQGWGISTIKIFNFIQLFQKNRQWFFYKNVFAALQSFQRQPCVLIVAGGDQYQIYLVVLQNFVVIGGAVGDAVFLRQRGARQAVGTGYVLQVHTF